MKSEKFAIVNTEDGTENPSSVYENAIRLVGENDTTVFIEYQNIVSKNSTHLY